MKKKNLIVSMLALLSAACCGIGGAVISADANTATQPTESYVETVKGQKVATKGFALEDGASVLMKTNNAGIRYSTVVSQGFIDYLNDTYAGASFEWHTLITGTSMLPVDGDVTDVTYDLKKPAKPNELACRDFTLEPSGAENNYKASIIYTGEEIENLSEETKLGIYGTDLISRSYVKVTLDDTVEYIYSQANDTTRNMKAVAYEAFIEGEYTEAQENVLCSYFGTTLENSSSFVHINETVSDNYSNAENYGAITVSALSGTVKEVYVNAKKVNVTQDGVEITLSNVSGLTDGENYYLNIFTNNGIYTQKFVCNNVWTGDALVYSSADKQVSLPDGLLVNDETLVSVKDETETKTYYENGAWTDAMPLTDEQLKTNAPITENLVVEKSTGVKYIVSAVKYAGIIDELNDFATFFSTSTDSSQDAKTNYGYYIVAKDLIAPTTTVTVSHLTKGQGGFAGVLDGNGHTVSFTLTANCDTTTWVGGYGLFGSYLYGNVTVKNIAFTNMTLTGTNIGGLFAGNTAYDDNANASLTLENVYIEGANQSKTAYANLVTGMKGQGSFVMTNVVIETAEGHGKNNYYQKGVFHGSGVSATSFTCKDVYVITSGALSSVEGTPKDYSGENGTATTKFAGMRVYESYDEMATDKTNGVINYDTFSDTYWVTTGDYPVWKSLND